MSKFIGDFLGFSIGDIHSSELKIVRTSSGDRYEQGLLPEFKDTTVEIPGGDGMYYFDSHYTSKKFQIDFAFDSLTEFEIRRLSQILGFKGTQWLIFDETPYKKYRVKCAQPPTIKYICFEGQNGVDVYKGEGTLNLIAYYPFGVSQEIEVEVEQQTMVASVENRAIVSSEPGWIITNSGDLPIDNLKIVFNGNDIETGDLLTLWHRTSGRQRNAQITFDFGNRYLSEIYGTNKMFMIDMKNKLFQRVSTYWEDGNFKYKPKDICNNYLTGDSKFFSIPVSGSYGFCFYSDYGNSRKSLSHGFKYMYRLIYY